MQYTMIGDETGPTNITVFVPGQDPLVAASSHPNFDEIVLRAFENDESVVDLFDVALTVGQKFDRLTDRVTVSHGKLYLDGDEIHTVLTEQVLRFLKEGVDDWKPLVLFFENVQANPNEHSREQLYPWIQQQGITITEDGMLVGYKGVGSDLKSKNAGTAIVNGQVVKGQIPNPIGAVVEMPRTEVMHNPREDCDAGLHVGSFKYAKGYADVVLEVHVNPRDVVSVPDASFKLRTCRYTVVKQITEAYTTPVKIMRGKTEPRSKKMPSITAARAAVKQHGSIDKASAALGVTRDAFRSFCHEKNIHTVKPKK